MKRFSLMLMGFYLNLLWQTSLAQGPQIEATLAGQNFWNTNYNIWEPTLPPRLAHWQKVEESGVTLVRAGGNAYNNGQGIKNSRPSDPLGYVRIVDEIRSNCKTCEPVITIPFSLPNSPVYNHTDPQFQSHLQTSIQNGKQILRLLNLVHKRNVKYIIIANEPGIDYGWPKDNHAQRITYANNVKAYFEPMAKALKEVDPEIKIIGPCSENYDKTVYDELFPVNGNGLAGLIKSGPAAGKPLVDFIAVNQYVYGNAYNNNADYLDPCDATPCSYEYLYTELEKVKKGQWDETRRYRGVLKDLRDKGNNSDLLSVRNGQKLGYMITEANITHDIRIDTELTDTRSPLGGRLWSRMLALASEYECSSLLFWSVSEGSSADDPHNRGYLDHAGAKRPSYYHYQAFTKWMKGQFLKDEILNARITSNTNNTISGASANFHCIQLPNGSTCAGGISHSDFETMAFAAKGTFISVMVLNHSATAKTYALNLNNGTPSGTFDKKFSFKAGVNTEQNFSIDGESTEVLIFSCAGELLERWKYFSTGFQKTYTHPDPTKVPNVLNHQINSSPSVCPTSSSIGFYGALNGLNFSWYKGGDLINGTSNFKGQLTAGQYSIKMVNNTTNGNLAVCLQTSVIVPVTIHHPSLIVDAGEDKVQCGSQALIGNPALPVQSGINYTWSQIPSPCTNYSASGCREGYANLLNTPMTSTTYTITATKQGECSISDQVTVRRFKASELMIKDNWEDKGDQPNNTTNISYRSPDIWIRRDQDIETSTVSIGISMSIIIKMVLVEIQKIMCMLK
ncbi:MAG: hypothetical protein H0X62_04155 [Bacteroidetes bacterium]|nr:hypothetical protein [Bacteroidota bacterium]